MKKTDRDWMLEETIRAYRGLDDDALGVLKAHWPADRIRQEAIAAVLAERDRPSITCPVCRMVSYNPNDVRERYCGHCHQFHDEMP